MQFVRSMARLSLVALSGLAAPGARALPGVLIAGVLSIAPMSTRAAEEPAYEVQQTLAPGVELRRYEPYAVAEVVVPGPEGDAANQAFPILLAYISGGNKGERKLAMTAPATQVATPVKISMTAPVTQAAAPGGYTVQFVLPRGTTAATAPEPTDPRVQLREMPAVRVAAIRYSGFWSASNYAEHLATLQAALDAAGLATTGDPVYARYDPPFKPWFMRRNEIWLPLR